MYLDTSVLAALYVPEALSTAAAVALAGETPVVSVLSELEFSSAVARRVRERSVSGADGATVLKEFERHLTEQRYLRLTVGKDDFVEARALIDSGKAPLAALDALHLAVAAANRQTILTADLQMARAAARFAIKVRLLRN